MIGFLGIGRHRRLRALLSSYIDGELSNSELGFLEAHLPGCDLCRSELDSLRSVVGLVRELPQLALPRSFALAAAPATVSIGTPFVWPVRVAASVAALLLVAVIVSDVLDVGRSPGIPETGAVAQVERTVEVEKEVVLESEAAPESETAVMAEPVLEMAVEAPMEKETVRETVRETAVQALEEEEAVATEAAVAEFEVVEADAGAPPERERRLLATPEDVAEESDVTAAPSVQTTQEKKVALEQAAVPVEAPEPSEPLERAEQEDGFPFRQLEIAAGAALALLLAAAIWTSRRGRRGWPGL